MSTALANLAGFKILVMDSLMFHLYEPVRRRHERQLEEMIVKNSLTQRSSVRAFRYKGMVYRSKEAPKGPIMSPALHPEFQPDMNFMRAEQEEIRDTEEPMVKGFITAMLNLSGNVDDYLLLFPESVHAPIKMLCLVSRTERKFHTAADVAPIHERYATCIQLMKQRMAANLIFQ